MGTGFLCVGIGALPLLARLLVTVYWSGLLVDGAGALLCVGRFRGEEADGMGVVS